MKLVILLLVSSFFQIDSFSLDGFVTFKNL